MQPLARKGPESRGALVGHRTSLGQPGICHKKNEAMSLARSLQYRREVKRVG